MYLATLLQPQGMGGGVRLHSHDLETQLGERMAKMTPTRIPKCRVAASLWRGETRPHHGIVHSGFQSALHQGRGGSKLYEKDRPASKDKNGTS